jgi:hypothetical protein
VGEGVSSVQQVSYSTYLSLKYYVEIINEAAICMELPITLIFWGFLFKILL